MMDDPKEVTPEELDETTGEELPDREAMSVIPFPSEPILPIEPPATE